MDRKMIYNKTDEFITGRWWSIVLIHIISAIISFAIISIIMRLFVGSILGALVYAAESGDDLYFLTVIIQVINYISLGSALSGLITETIKGGLEIQILNGYETGEAITISNVIDAIRANFASIFVAVIIISAVTIGLGYIPFIRSFSGIIITVFTYAVAFSFFLIGKGKSKDGISAITDSFELTRGHKFNLFLMSLNYYFRPFIGLLIMIVGAFFIEAIPALFGVLFFAGLIVVIVLAVKYIPYLTVANTIYFSLLTENDTTIERTEEVVKAEVVKEEVVEAEVVEAEVLDNDSNEA